MLYDRVASEQHLRTLFDEFEASGGRPEAIVFTGDLADQGEPDAYDRIRAHRRPRRRPPRRPGHLGHGQPRRPRGLPSRPARRAARRRPARSTASTTSTACASSPSTRPCPATTTARSRRRSSTGSPRSSRSRRRTARSSRCTTRPCRACSTSRSSVELRDQSGLAEVVEGSDIRSIIAGHLHYSSTATFAGVPVSVASASCYTQDLNVPVGGTRGRDGARAFNLVHVYPTHGAALGRAARRVPRARLDRRRRERAPARRVGHQHRGCRDAAGPKEPPFTMPIPVLALTPSHDRVGSGGEVGLVGGRDGRRSAAASVAFSHGAGNGK